MNLGSAVAGTSVAGTHATPTVQREQLVFGARQRERSRCPGKLSIFKFRAQLL